MLHLVLFTPPWGGRPLPDCFRIFRFRPFRPKVNARIWETAGHETRHNITLRDLAQSSQRKSFMLSSSLIFKLKWYNSHLYMMLDFLPLQDTAWHVKQCNIVCSVDRGIKRWCNFVPLSTHQRERERGFRASERELTQMGKFQVEIKKVLHTLTF